MRAVIVTKTGFRNLKCSICRRLGQPEDVMLMEGIGPNWSKTYKRIGWHRDCVIGVILAAPKSGDEYVREYEQLRKLIGDTGQLFAEDVSEGPE